MVTVPCKHCGKQVAPNCTKCPHCGGTYGLTKEQLRKAEQEGSIQAAGCILIMLAIGALLFFWKDLWKWFGS